ncbi:MAG: hypothetical protein FJX47_13565, partial [Alphaproteobacteria bacterium]|nr:hypothetical protein [Alphaproteobacteria bacterium]
MGDHASEEARQQGWIAALTAGILVIGAAFASAWLGIEALRDFEKALSHLASVKALDASGRSIYELQKERGYTVMVLRSEGRDYAFELALQRDRVDLAVHDLAAHPAQDKAIDRMDSSLKLIRSEVDRGGARIGETYRGFSEQIDRLIEAAYASIEMSRLPSYAAAYIDLLFASEAMGLERVLGASELIGQDFDPETLRKLIELRGAQAAHIQAVRLRLPKGITETLGSRIADERVRSTIETIRRGIEDKGETIGEPALAAAQWFAAQTARIDALRSVWEEIGREIAAESHASLARAKGRAAWSAALMLVAALAVILVTHAVVARFARERDRLRRILDGNPDPICIASDADHIVWSNAAFRRAFPGAEPGHPRLAYFGRNDHFAYAGTALADLRSGRSYDVVETVLPGGLGWGERQFVLRDVTAIARSMAEIRAAREIADSANRAKTNFLSVMSHELRTPLNAVIGFSQMIEHETRGPIGSRAYVDYAKDIGHAGGHLLAIVNDILDYARLESGHLRLHPVDLDLSEVVRQATRMIRGPAEERGASVDLTLTKDLLVHGDPVRLRQVVLNLLSNAVKFTRPGSCIAIALGPTEAGDVKLSVRDEGIGISPEGIARAFEPFGSDGNPLTRNREGVGLGLPISRKIIEQHGGTIQITSIP